MPIKNVNGQENLRKSTLAHWDNVREQLAGITDNEKKTALLEIMALRAIAIEYENRANQAEINAAATKRKNKSFVR